MKKKRIAVLFGGCSTEYQVSLQSAYAVMSQIDTSLYDLIPIGLERHTGKWFWYRGELYEIPKNNWCRESVCTPVFLSPDRGIHGLLYLENGRQMMLSLDGALPVMHGKNGEDGTVQGVLELSGIRLIGCGTLSSALCMDKLAAHRMAEAGGILCPRSVLTESSEEESLKKAISSLSFPVFVKPVRSGSSFGITRVKDKRELLPAVRKAFEHDTRVLIEEAVDGFEVGCAVVGTEKLLTGEVDEIELSGDFFDYTEKYTLKTSRIHVPARIPAALAQEVKETACRIYRIMGCSGFARVDMFLTPDGRIWFNEVNTIPGFTAHSRFPSMLKAAGISFDEVIRMILQEGLA